MGAELGFFATHQLLLAQAREVERQQRERPADPTVIDIPPEDVTDITDQRRLEHKP